MSSAKITSKGQITIPQEVRKAMGVGEGDRVDFVPMPDGGFAVKAATKSIEVLKGRVKWTGKPISDAEMDAAIAEEIAARYRKIKPKS